MAWPSSSARTKTWISEVLTSADQQGQLDILHNYLNDSLNGTTGHGHTGGTSDGPQLDLTLGVTGILPTANGGTGASSVAGFLGNVYPIGCIYTTVDSTNPATVFGFGTWSTFGAGKVLIGVDSGDTDYQIVEQVGGSKTHTLTIPELVPHTHTQNVNNSAGGSLKETTYVTQGGQITGDTTTGSTGGGTAFSIVQSFITVYFFKRDS